MLLLTEYFDDTGYAGIVEEHGALQDAMFVLAEQAAALDAQYRSMSTERNQYKVPAECEQTTAMRCSMNEAMELSLRFGARGSHACELAQTAMSLLASHSLFTHLR